MFRWCVCGCGRGDGREPRFPPRLAGLPFPLDEDEFPVRRPPFGTCSFPAS